MNTGKLTFRRLGMTQENNLVEAPPHLLKPGQKATLSLEEGGEAGFAFDVMKWRKEENCGMAFVDENTTQYIQKTGTTFTQHTEKTSMQYLREIIQANEKYAVLVKTEDGTYRVVED